VATAGVSAFSTGDRTAEKTKEMKKEMHNKRNAMVAAVEEFFYGENFDFRKKRVGVGPDHVLTKFKRVPRL
jgi:hypothetical protein